MAPLSVVTLDTIAELLAAGEGRFEWADGRLIEISPPSSDHVRKSTFLTILLHAYAEAQDLGQVFGEGLAQRIDPSRARVPDVSFFRKENLHKVGPKNAEGAAAGVEEYRIVDPERREAEFYCLDDGVYERVVPDAEGRLHSSVMPGFSLRVEWLWNRPTPRDAMRDLGLP